MSKEKSRFSPFVKQCFVTGAVCANIVGHGCVLGFPGVLLPQLHRPDSAIHIGEGAGSWLASITGPVMLIGALIMYPLMGGSRKTAHLAVTAPVLVGWGITIFATSYQAVFIGRVLCGISHGMLSPLRSVLIGEYTSPKNRGAFLTTVTLAQAFGIFLVHLLGSFLPWKTTAIIVLSFPLTSLIMTIFSPESPSWLASQGRYDDCRRVFRWLRGDEEDRELEAMIEARIRMKNISESQGKNNNRLKSLSTTIQKKEFYKPIIIMMHANFLIHFSGATTMASYSTKILGLLMGPEANLHFWMIFLDSQRIFFNGIAVYIVNRTKRRTMFYTIGSLSVIAHLAIAFYVWNTKGVESRSIWLPALLINIQFFTVAVGMLPLPNVIAGEVFPLEYKGIGGMFSMISNAGFLFTVLKTFPALTGAVGLEGTYVLYACLLTYNLLVILFMLPETYGKTLQQIEDEFRGRPLAPEEMEARKSLAGETVIELKEKKKDADPEKGSTHLLSSK